MGSVIQIGDLWGVSDNVWAYGCHTENISNIEFSCETEYDIIALAKNNTKKKESEDEINDCLPQGLQQIDEEEKA